MVVPRKKHTSSQVKRRRLHDALEKTALKKCPKCGKAVKTHQACGFCGSYKGKTVLKVKAKAKTKKTK